MPSWQVKGEDAVRYGSSDEDMADDEDEEEDGEEAEEEANIVDEN